jgi:membrane protein
MKKIIAFILFSYKHFMNNLCLTRAGSLAFTTIISIVPLMVIGLSVISIFPISQILESRIQNFIFSNFLVSSATVILNYVELFVNRVHMLSLISLVFVTGTAVSIMLSVTASLNAIWRVKKLRHWYHAIFFYSLILFLTPLLITASLLLSFYISYVMHRLWHGHLFADLFIAILPIFISYLGFLWIYKVMPNCYIPWRFANIGALVAAVLFELAKIIFSWYIRAFPTYQAVYGAISALPILLIWIYICWLIFLVGGLISYTVKNFIYERTTGKSNITSS